MMRSEISKFFYFLLAFLLIGPMYASTRIAVYNTVSDFDQWAADRRFLLGFDAQLQHELINGWNAELVSRTGLSSIVFEQKLAQAKDSSVKEVTVLSADSMVISVLDAEKKQLRVYVNKVVEGMKAPSPKLFTYKNRNELVSRLPREVAKYVASVNGLEKPQEKEVNLTGKRSSYTCALLYPVINHNNKSTFAGQSQLVHAFIENALASQADVTMVEREEIDRVLEEKVLAASGITESNSASDLGRLLGADIVFYPIICPHSENKVYSYLFSIDVHTGRLIASLAWTGDSVTSPDRDALSNLANRALAGMQADGENADDPAKRYAEAKYLMLLEKSFYYLRQRVDTTAIIAQTFADSGMALAHDEPELVAKVLSTFLGRSLPTVRHSKYLEYSPNDDVSTDYRMLVESNQLGSIRDSARKIFKSAVYSNLSSKESLNLSLRCSYHLLMDEGELAYEQLRASDLSEDELATKLNLYARYSEALMATGRYKECINFMQKRDDYSDDLNRILLHAYRAADLPDEEFKLMRQRLEKMANSSDEDIFARYLELAAKSNDPLKALREYQKYVHYYIYNHEVLRLPLANLELAAGKKDDAISGLQMALLSFKMSQNREGIRAATKMLKDIGGEEISKISLPREFITLPKGMYVEVIHDQTITPQFAKDVAGFIADSWGCEVHLSKVEMNPEKLSFHNKLDGSTNAYWFVMGLRSLRDRSEDCIQSIYLTDLKIVQRSNQRGTGALYGLATPQQSMRLVSSHYFQKYKAYDKRPLAYITSIAAANLWVIDKLLRVEYAKENPEYPKYWAHKPEMIANNGQLVMTSMELGVSQQTGELIRKIEEESIRELVREKIELDHKFATEKPIKEQDYFWRIRAEMDKQEPIIVSPKGMEKK